MNCMYSMAAVTALSLAARSIFRRCYDPTVLKWTTEKGNTIKLIKHGPDLKWVLSEKDKNKKHFASALNDALNLETYAKEVEPSERKKVVDQGHRLREKILREKDANFDSVKWMRRIPLDKRIAFFKDHDLGEALVYPDGKLEVEITPFGIPSQYDENVILTRDNWAVTLLSAGSSAGGAGAVTTSLGFIGHTVVVYEGLKNRKLFYGFADLRGDAQGIGNVHHEAEIYPFPHTAKSKTWLRKSYQVLSMIESIQRDIVLQKTKVLHQFSILGGQSVLQLVPSLIKGLFGYREPVKVNCHTWAVMTLSEAGIHAGSISHLIAPIPVFEIALLKW